MPRRNATSWYETEADFQAKVLELAKVCGWLAYHTFDSRRSQPGFPDLVLVRPPQIVFVELKSARGAVRYEQAVWIAALSACTDVTTRLWRPADWDDLVTTLNRTPEASP